MSLLSILEENLSSVYHDTTNDDWVQFLRDHLSYLRDRSIIENITDTVMPEVRYNITRFLRKVGLPTSVWWIVLELNGFKNDFDFHTNIVSARPSSDGVLMKLYVPQESTLRELYQLWLTTADARKGSTLTTSL